MPVKHSLQGSQLFQGLSDEQLQLFSAICEDVPVEKGTRIFEEGEHARFVYVVERGRVALTMRLDRPDGSVTHPTTVASLGPGEAFAWSAIVDPTVLTLSAQAVEDSNLVRIDGEKLREMLNSRRDVGYLVMVNVAKLLGGRLAQTREAFVYERDWTFQQGAEREES